MEANRTTQRDSIDCYWVLTPEGDRAIAASIH